MATQVQFRGGTTTEHSSFNGVAREVTVDTTKKTLVVQDGSTNGGFPLLRQDLDNLPAGTIKTADIDGDQITGALIADDAVGAEHIEVLDAALQFGDNAKAQFGASNDLDIFHDSGSTKSMINNQNGELRIVCDSAIRIAKRHDATIAYDDNMIIANPDGSVQLFYDGGANPKLETTSDGVSVTGHIAVADDNQIRFGASNDFVIQHNTNENYIQSNSGHIYIRANVNDDEGDNIYIQPKSGENSAIFTHDGAVELYHDGTKTFETFSKGVVVRGTAGDDGEIQLYADGGTANADCWMLKAESGAAEMDIANYADGAWETNIRFNANNSTNLYYDGTAKFWTTTAGAQAVGSELKLYNSVDTSNTYFYAENTSSGNAGIKMKNSSGEWTIIANDRLRFIDNDASVERLSLLSDGKVGIGFTAPTNAQFTVSGGAANSNIAIFTGVDQSRGLKLSTTANGQNDQNVIYNAQGSNGQHIFQCNGSQKFQIQNAGNCNIVDGNLVLASGHGIDFSAQTATSESGAAQGNSPAEVLDHYEEGTWTPVLGGSTNNGTYNVSGSGHYTRIGRLVFVALRFNGVNLDNNAAGDVIITGLPFTNHANASTPNTNNMFGGLAEYNTTFNIDDMHDWYPGNTYIYSLSSDNGTNWYSRSASAFHAGTMYINMAGWYITS